MTAGYWTCITDHSDHATGCVYVAAHSLAGLDAAEAVTR